MAVESIEETHVEETVYNWSVAEYHTYYVSAGHDGASLWAHNTGADCAGAGKEEEEKPAGTGAAAAGGEGGATPSGGSGFEAKQDTTSGQWGVWDPTMNGGQGGWIVEPNPTRTAEGAEATTDTLNGVAPAGPTPPPPQPPATQQSPPRGLRNPTQDKMLTPGEIKRLKDAGIDVHKVKGGKNASKRDLYKDARGNIHVKPKGGHGEGDPTGLNINDY